MKINKVMRSGILTLAIIFLASLCFIAVGQENISGKQAVAADIGIMPMSINGDGTDGHWVIEGSDTHTVSMEDLEGVMLIPNKEYFLINPKAHRNSIEDNSQGTCTTVAYQMLLGYHNYYSDRRLIPAEQDGKIFLDVDYGKVEKHPEFARTMTSDGDKSIGTEDDVYQEIFDESLWPEFPGLGQAINLIADGTKKFISKYSGEAAKDTIVDWAFFNDDTATAEIDAGNPVILGLSALTDADTFHVVVAYGYANYNGEKGYLVHFGWENRITMGWLPQSYMFVMSKITVNHVHNFEDTEKILRNTHRVLKCKDCGYEKPELIYDIVGEEITATKFSLNGEVSIPFNINSTTKGNFKISSIGAGAFANQTAINSISLPSAIKTIGAGAFENCSGLTSITGSYNFETIGNNAFKGCGALRNIYISNTTKNIGMGAFAGCNSLGFTVPAANPNFSEQNGILYNKDGTSIIASGKTAMTVTIPSSVTAIGDGAFMENSVIKVLKIEGMPSIGEYAFAHCPNLNSVYFDSYTPPADNRNCFAGNKFKLYVPYVSQDAYREKFKLDTDDIDSIEIQVSFVSDGAATDTKTVYYGSIIDDLPVPVKAGYDFLGWYGDPAFGGAAYEQSELWNVKENVSLYAKIEPKHYYLAFAGEGSEGLEPQETVFDSVVGTLPVITRTGYEFLGWKADDGTYYTADTVWRNTENIVLTSDWEANDYTVTLDTNGGTIDGADSFTVTFGGEYSIAASVTKTGYTFEGWYDGDGVKYLNAEGAAVRLWDKDCDATLYACWHVKSYEIQINNDGSIKWLGATGLSDEQCAIEYGTILNERDLVNTYKNSSHGFKEGMIFDHFEFNEATVDWSSIPDLGNDGEVIGIIPVWVLEKHRIFFSTFTTFLVDEIEEYYGSPIKLPMREYKNGYTFTGWYTDAVNGEKVNWTTMPDLTPNTQRKGAVTLYAHYTENMHYFVSYDSNGGTGTMSQSVHEYDREKSLSANLFKRTGYTFGGWLDESTGETYNNCQKVINLTTEQYGTVVLKAQWNPNEYKVTFNKQGGDNGTSFVIVTFDRAMPTATAPWKAFYNFQGYYSQQNGGGVKFYDAYMNSVNNWTTDSDVTLYAYWIGYEYGIIYHNIEFLGQTADVILDNYLYNFAPTHYNYGTGLDLNRVSAFYQSSSPYSPQLRFLGWYTNMNFTSEVTGISTVRTGHVHLYAKWRYDYDNPSRSGTCKIDKTDPKDQAEQDQKYLGLGSNNLYQELIKIGITKLTFTFKMRSWGENTQHVFVLSESGSILAETSFDSTSSAAVHTCRFTIELSNLGAANYIYISYQAESYWSWFQMKSRYWYNDYIYMEMSYVVSESDINSPEFYWHSQDPFK